MVCTLYVILRRLVSPTRRGRDCSEREGTHLRSGGKEVAELDWTSGLRFWAHSLGRDSDMVLPACTDVLAWGSGRARASKLWAQPWPHMRLLWAFTTRTCRGWRGAGHR